MDIRAKNSLLIVIPLIAGTTSYTFGLQETLANTKLTHLIYVPDNIKSPLGSQNLQGNSGIYVTFVDRQNDQVHDSIPAVLLSAQAKQSFMFDTEKIAWQKSKVVISDASAIPANNCLMFLAIYE